MIFLVFSMVISVFVSHCNGEYTCLCNYNVETPVYESADTSAHPIGYMYEFDCKSILSEDNPGWTTIAFEHKIGFVEKSSGIRDQVCPGEIPTGDKLPTTTMSTKAAVTTTVSTLISSSLSTTLPLQTVSNLFSKSSLSSLSSAPLLSSIDSFSSSFAYTKSPLPTEHKTTFSVPLLKSSISTSSAPKTLSSLLTSLQVLSSPSASIPPSSNSSLHSISPHFNVLSTSLNSSFSTTTLLSSDKTYASPSIAYGPVNVSSPLPTTKVNDTLGTSDKITSLDTATLNKYSTTLSKTSSKTNSTFTVSENSDISSSTYSSSTLYDILRTSELPSMPAASLTSGSSSWHTSAQSTDSNANNYSSTKLMNSNSSSSLYNSTLSPNNSTSETYSTSKTNIISSHSEVSSKMTDLTTARSSVSTGSFSTMLMQSSGNSLPPLETSLPTRSSVEETTMATSLTNMKTISTVSVNRTHGTLKDRTDLCPYEYLAKSEYYSNTYTYPLFRQYGNFCYELRLELGSWIEGQSDCVKRGGELAIINNSEVQERLFNLTSSLQHKMYVWIGLHDLYQEGRWEWVDGEKLTQSGYNKGILITRVYNDARDCVVIDGSSGVWKNVACQSVLFDIHSHPWICQYTIT